MNVSGQQLTGSGVDLTQSDGYDAVNRLNSARETMYGENRLRESRLNGAVTTYAYDGERRRVKKRGHRQRCMYTMQVAHWRRNTAASRRVRAAAT